MSGKKIYVCPVCGCRFLQWPSQVRGAAYCSRECYKASMLGRIPYNKGKKLIIEKACAYCGKIMSGIPSAIKRKKFCSPKCFSDSIRGNLEQALKRYIVDEVTGCWLWTGGTRGGYGRLKLAGRGQVEAHRISYEFHVGEIPEGMVLDHLCRNRSCINPAHLEAVTIKENIMRGEQGSKDAMRKHWETRRKNKNGERK